MGRKAKTGLDYFPVDVDLFTDDKMLLISSEFGIKGEIIYIRLLCKIYKNGYFYQWGEDEALLFAKGVGNEITGALVNEVVKGCVRRSLFDERVFNMFKILTSKGIQERYQYICKQLKRPVQIDLKYDCSDLTKLKRELSPEKYSFPPEEINKTPEESTQRKGKERKGNENEEEAPSPSGFLKRLFSDMGEADRENICIQIRKQAINPQWAVQFNAHLHTNRKVHASYDNWLSHFTAWLRTRSAELEAETTVNAIHKNKSVWK